MNWNTENPPKDGSPIVAVGRVIASDELSTWVDPFIAAVFWSKKESGFEGWCLFHNQFNLAVAQSLDDKVIIDFWAELPGQKQQQKIQEAA